MLSWFKQCALFLMHRPISHLISAHNSSIATLQRLLDTIPDLQSSSVEPLHDWLFAVDAEMVSSQSPTHPYLFANTFVSCMNGLWPIACEAPLALVFLSGPIRSCSSSCGRTGCVSFRLSFAFETSTHLPQIPANP